MRWTSGYASTPSTAQATARAPSFRALLVHFPDRLTIGIVE